MISSSTYKQHLTSAHVLANALELGVPKFHVPKRPPSLTFRESVCQSITFSVLKSNGTCHTPWLSGWPSGMCSH